ncbi:MAG: sodium:calcium antiporter [Acidimicrobiales bacterium]
MIVGFGTSAPEMVVSGLAAFNGDLDIGVGNVIGSNVANISLVLAAAAFITVIPVDSRTVRREAPIAVASALLVAGLVQGELGRAEGALLAAGLIAVLLAVVMTARADDPLAAEVEEYVDGEPLRMPVEVLRTLVGLAFVVGSSWTIVEGSTRIADALDLSGGFVGFTLVAVGTSTPELVTSIVAARQGETDLLVGNLLGSNVFNSLAVGGVIGVVGPGPVLDTTLAEWGSVLMIAIVLISWAMMITGARVTRREGLVLLGLWIASVVVLSQGETAALAVVGGGP